MLTDVIWIFQNKQKPFPQEEERVFESLKSTILVYYI
jgi:hypothetical protein